MGFNNGEIFGDLVMSNGNRKRPYPKTLREEINALRRTLIRQGYTSESIITIILNEYGPEIRAEKAIVRLAKSLEQSVNNQQRSVNHECLHCREQNY